MRAAMLLLVLAAPLVAEETDPFPLQVGTEWTFDIGNDKIFPVPGQQVRFVVAEKRVAEGQTAEWTRIDTFGPKDTVPQQMEFYTNDGKFIYLHRRAIIGNHVDLTPPCPKLPSLPTEGQKWDWHGDFGDQEAVGKFTVEAYEWCEVPAGKFASWRVRYEYEMKDGTKVLSVMWFSPGVGMIQQDDTVTSAGNSQRRIGKLKLYKAAK